MPLSCKIFFIVLGLVGLSACNRYNPLDPFSYDKRAVRYGQISVDNQSDYFVKAYVSISEGTHDEGCDSGQYVEKEAKIAPHSQQALTVQMTCLTSQDWRRGYAKAEIIPPSGSAATFSSVEITRKEMSGDTVSVYCDNSGCKRQ